jgi:hypothetical protein
MYVTGMGQKLTHNDDYNNYTEKFHMLKMLDIGKIKTFSFETFFSADPSGRAV